MTVAVQDPGGLGFALITTDESRPDPADVADAALEAMREEYPDLDAAPAMETINEQVATGHDVEFFAMDMTNAASIRCFRTRAAPSWRLANGPMWARPTFPT